MTNLTPREEAIDDCKYAIGLSEVALREHIKNWITTLDCDTDYEVEYTQTIQEIYHKLNTEECLLK